MAVDATAVARVTGISTSFKDLRSGGVQFCPQRIVVLAQGKTGVVYSSAKRQVTSAPETGAVYGYGSPAHLIVEQLFPTNGDGVDTIPVTIYPLQDDAGASAAQGSITPSGTLTQAGAFRVRVNGIQSNQFVLPYNNGSPLVVTDACRVMGQAVSAVLDMPVSVTYTYGAVTASALVGTGNGTITALSVTGAPAPGVYTLKVNTAVANGGVWTLTDPSGSVISSTVTMTPGVGGVTVISVGGLQFSLTDGTTDFGVGATFTITVPATNTKLTSNWKGSSANDLFIEMIGDSTLGAVFTVVQPTGGLVNPQTAAIQAALAQIGNVNETLIINAMELSDVTTLNVIQTVGDGRWGPLVRKPFVCFTGENAIAVGTVDAVPSARPTDKINCAIPSPGSPNLSFVIAAKAVARIAKMANNNPATGYGSQPLTGLIPGNDGDQWDYPTRDLAVKAGTSTVEVVDGVIQLSDVVTFYHPTGEPIPAYRQVVNIVKLQNVLYNLDLTFSAPEWAAAPLVPDSQATKNVNARKPKNAVSETAALLDSLGDEAIISDPASAKKTIVAGIDSQNPDRLNLAVTVQVSGNSNVKNVDLSFGFFFGGAAA